MKPCVDAAAILKEKGISATVVDMYCVKPLDEAAVIKAAENAKAVITVEEHAPYGGLGSMVSQVSQLPEESDQSGAAGCSGDHRYFQGSV